MLLYFLCYTTLRYVIILSILHYKILYSATFAFTKHFVLATYK